MRAALAIVLCSSLAWAAPSAKAKAAYERGMSLYAIEHWDEAIHEFEIGYVEQPAPSFLYNIAQAHKRAGRRDRAADYFQKYLEMRPDAPDRVEVARWIEELRPKVVVVVAPPPATVTVVAPPPPTPSKPVYKRWWLWTTLAVVVLAGVGVALGLTLAPQGPDSDFGKFYFGK
jgi:tetratricopeptide (TPR) repeat protein